jgi:hypothetical protein
LISNVVPSSLFKLDESLNYLIQEESINDVCNKAFDKLLIQEFNSDQEDFEPNQENCEDDIRQEAECGDECGKFYFTGFHYISSTHICFLITLKGFSGVAVRQRISFYTYLFVLSYLILFCARKEQKPKSIRFAQVSLSTYFVSSFQFDPCFLLSLFLLVLFLEF